MVVPPPPATLRPGQGGAGSPPRPTATRDAAAIADAVLPGRGTVALRTDDLLGNRLFVAPASRLRVRAASTQLVGVAVCPLGCTVRVRAAIDPRGPGAAIRTRQLTVRAGATGAALRVVTSVALRRRIQRAGGATATLTIRHLDATGTAHRTIAKLRLLPAAP